MLGGVVIVNKGRKIAGWLQNKSSTGFSPSSRSRLSGRWPCRPACGKIRGMTARLTVEKRAFARHAQRNAECQFHLGPEQFQIQARAADGIHHAVVHVETAGSLRRRRGGDAEV